MFSQHYFCLLTELSSRTGCSSNQITKFRRFRSGITVYSTLCQIRDKAKIRDFNQ